MMSSWTVSPAVLGKDVLTSTAEFLSTDNAFFRETKQQKPPKTHVAVLFCYVCMCYETETFIYAYNKSITQKTNEKLSNG